MLIQARVSCKWTDDTQRLLLEHFDTINNSPSYIYHDALPFSPLSWLYKHYPAELAQAVRVVKGIPAEWGKCCCTVLLDSDILDLSYCNNTIAVGSVHGDITIFDAITGNWTTILSWHTDEVNTLTFSLDGRSLVSGSNDKTVRLWDMQTGGIVKTFSGHIGEVLSVSISPDLTTIASVSDHGSINLWDNWTGECYCVIEQQGYVNHLAFSPTNPQCLLSVCNAKVWQWDINGHQVGSTFNGFHAAFSSDGTQLVTCNRGVVTVQNFSSGVIVAEFNVANGNTTYCCFSPDDRLIAVAVGGTACVWNSASSEPCLIETFVVHTRVINSLAFSSSSSLISVSVDNSINFWQIGIQSTDLVMTNPKSTSLTSAEIRSTTLQGKDGITITSDSDGVVKTWDILTGLCKESFQTPAKGTCKRDVQLINGKLILVWCADGKINIWDAEKGELLLAVDGVEPGQPKDLKISGDGYRVLCLDRTSIQAWSIQTGEFVDKMGINCVGLRRGSLIVDGSRVWAHYTNSRYEGWDFGTPGSSLVWLSNIPLGRLHPNGVLLWDVGLSQVRDRVTGEVVFQLPERYGKPIDV